MVGLILNLSFHKEDSYGFRDTVTIFLFPRISLLDISEAALVVMQWYMVLDSSILTTYSDTAYLLQC